MDWISVKETATLLNTSESWVYVHRFEFRWARFGRLLRFDRASLIEYIANRVKAPSGTQPEGTKLGQKIQ